jgi:hypothetical protein
LSARRLTTRGGGCLCRAEKSRTSRPPGSSACPASDRSASKKKASKPQQKKKKPREKKLNSSFFARLSDLLRTTEGSECGLPGGSGPANSRLSKPRAASGGRGPRDLGHASTSEPNTKKPAHAAAARSAGVACSTDPVCVCVREPDATDSEL